MSAAFSSSGRYLYVNSADTLWQYDLQHSDPHAARALIYVDSTDNQFGLGLSRLAPDGKIYFGNSAFDPSLPDVTYLHVVHAPDSAGLACRFERRGFYLDGGTCSHGLPYAPNYRLGPLIGPVAQAGKDTVLCRGDTMRLGARPVRDGLLYNWEPPDGLDDPTSPQPFAAPDTATTYTLTVTDPNFGAGPPCNQALASVELIVLPGGGARSGKDTAICMGDRIRLGAPPVRDGLLYNWEPADGLDDPASPQPFAAPDTTTTYTLTVTDPELAYNAFCNPATAIIEVKTHPLPNIDLPSDTSFCEELVLNAGQGGSWPGFTTDSVWTITEPGAYPVQRENDFGCVSEAEVRAELTPLPTISLPADTSFCGELVLNAGQGGSWPGFTTDSVLTITEPGAYAARRENDFGCVSEAEVRVLQDCPGAAMPNVFTPNGDGINDELRPALSGSFKTWSLAIYDNVGRKVFSTSNPLEGWNGTFRGSDAPAGVYFYILRATDEKGREIERSGTVTLLR